MNLFVPIAIGFERGSDIMENKNELPERLKLLNDEEIRAYRKYLDSGLAPLAASKAGEFFSLFLQGYSTFDIVKANPSFSLGLIVRARVDFNWDKHRDKYLEDLFGGIKEKISKVQMEAVSFTTDAMSVYHKLIGNRFKKFIQTGDEETLGDWKEFSFKNYKDFSEILLKLTGQNGKEGIKIEVNAKPEPRNSVDVEVIARPTVSDAADLLEKLIKEKN